MKVLKCTNFYNLQSPSLIVFQPRSTVNPSRFNQAYPDTSKKQLQKSEAIELVSIAFPPGISHVLIQRNAIPLLFSYLFLLIAFQPRSTVNPSRFQRVSFMSISKGPWSANPPWFKRASPNVRSGKQNSPGLQKPH